MTSQKVSAEEFSEILNGYMKTVAAEHNRERIMQRLRNRAESGYWVSRPPFGYSPNFKTKVMKINRKGRALQKLIEDFLDDKSKESFIDEVAKLISPRATRRQVYGVINNPFYRGKISYEGKIYHGLHEPLMNEAEYRVITERLAM
jgi:site-specific DNA recombinase